MRYVRRPAEQDPALARQPQPVTGDLLRREHGQLLEQLAGQTVSDTGIYFTSEPSTPAPAAASDTPPATPIRRSILIT